MIGKDKLRLISAYIGQIEKQKILVKCPPDPPISPIVHCLRCTTLMSFTFDVYLMYVDVEVLGLLSSVLHLNAYLKSVDCRGRC